MWPPHLFSASNAPAHTHSPHAYILYRLAAVYIGGGIPQIDH